VSQLLWIPGVLPGMNDFLEARMKSRRVASARGKRSNAYSDMKKDLDGLVWGCAKQQQLRPVLCAHFGFFHMRENRRSNPDNFCAGSQKVTLDGLQKAGVIKNDGWGEVLSLTHWWDVAFEPRRVGVAVFIGEPLSREQAFEAFLEAKPWKK